MYHCATVALTFPCVKLRSKTVSSLHPFTKDSAIAKAAYRFFFGPGYANASGKMQKALSRRRL